MTLLGAHVQRATNEALAWLRRARPRLVKWLDWSESGIATLAAIHAEWRPTLVGRVEQVDRLDPVAAADLIAEMARLCPFVDFWEGKNEPGSSRAEMQAANSWFSTFLLRLRLLNLAQGYPLPRVLVGSLSEGSPANLADFDLLVPAIRLAAKSGGGIATHEYDAPRLQTTAGWRVGRCRKLWEQLPADLRSVPWAITEFGIDFGVNHAGEELPPEDRARYVRTPNQGWQGRHSEAQYLEQLAWADGFLDELVGSQPGVTGPNLLGATIFTVGHFDPWGTFDVSGAWTIADYIRRGSARADPRGSAGVPSTPEPPSPKPSQETPMLYLAIIPSNQDRNRFTDHTGKLTDERVQCGQFAAKLLAAARAYPQIVARVFTGAPESQDKAHLVGLATQQAAARTWLDGAPAGTLTVALNLHTDSGKFSHVGYYYDGAAGEISARLGATLAGVVNRFVAGPILKADYRGYLFATAMGHKHCPVLLELGSHEVQADIRALSERGDEIARALADALARFFGLAALPVDWTALGEYARWSLGRIAHREDPRDRAAFVAHLRALGKPEPLDLRGHGWPGS